MNKQFRLGKWLIHPERNHILGPDSDTSIKLKSMAVLLQLAAADGRVVSKQALLDAIWGDAEVTEDVLTQCIVELRKAFQDSARKPEVIETIRGVGFRLIPPVTHVAHGETKHPQRRTTALVAGGAILASLFAVLLAMVSGVFPFKEHPSPASAPIPTIAVLPFANFSDDPENEYFADGLAEELLDRLTRVPGLRVSARTSSFAFRNRPTELSEIGRQLGVNSVLEGSVRRSGGRVRIAAQLIDVETGHHRWSQIYERDISDMFAVQDEISEAIVNALRPSLAASAVAEPVVGTLNTDAYDLYLLGRYYLAREQTSRALDFFERAVKIDPGFARGYAGIAESLLGFRETPRSFWISRSDREGLERAEWAAHMALKLNTNLAEAHIAQAALHAANRRIDEEAAALQKALELNPHSIDALTRLAKNLSAQRRLQESLQLFQQAIRRDPLNPKVVVAQSRLISQLRGYEEATSAPLRLLNSGVESPEIYQVLISMSSDFGRYVERVKWALRMVALDPDRGLAMAELADAYMELGEFELTRLWIERAAKVSPQESFKARARWLYASGNIEGFLGFLEDAFQRNPPRDGEPLQLEQMEFLGIYAISRVVKGDYYESALYAERILNESPTLPRRPSYIELFGRSVLALAYEGQGAMDKVKFLMSGSLQIARNAQEQGIVSYPPMTREIAKVYALLGDVEQARENQLKAVAQGWRRFYLEAKLAANPVQRLLKQDEKYLESLAEIQADLERMRRIVQRNGWRLTPDEFFTKYLHRIPSIKNSL